MSTNTTQNGSFRDQVGSLTQEGKRNWIFAKKPFGRFYKAREFVAAFLLIIFFAGPFITIHGHPLLQLNVLERKFVIFGFVFWPSDFYLIVLAALTLVLFIVLFTSIFGRVWCGWTCPQTIFMEMVFRKIEYWIEGDWSAQKRLNNAPWNREKIFKKIGKHTIFYAISFLIANIFLAYIIGIDALWKIITDPPSEHLTGLIIISLFSLVFYGVYSRFRGQVCQFVCPYGRYQSVLVDEDSIAVTYDFMLGEPRGNPKKVKKQKKAAVSREHVDIAALATGAPADFPDINDLGDCIDCGQCVRVCPAGIDIRNGIQMECIQCTACIDACDEVMDKIDKPRGLIRYASYNDVKERKHKFKFTPRVMGYSAVLLILLTLLVGLFFSRSDTQSIILRDPGTLYQQLQDGRYTNIYSYKFINKTFDTRSVEIKVQKPADGKLTLIGLAKPVGPQSIQQGRFFLALPTKDMQPGRTEVTFAVYSEGKLMDTVTSSFIGPDKLNRQNHPKNSEQ